MVAIDIQKPFAKLVSSMNLVMIIDSLQDGDFFTSMGLK